MIAFRRAVTPLLPDRGGGDAGRTRGPASPLPFELEPLVGLSDRLPPLGMSGSPSAR
jgi:hypothetical protein